MTDPYAVPEQSSPSPMASPTAEAQPTSLPESSSATKSSPQAESSPKNDVKVILDKVVELAQKAEGYPLVTQTVNELRSLVESALERYI